MRSTLSFLLLPFALAAPAQLPRAPQGSSPSFWGHSSPPFWGHYGGKNAAAYFLENDPAGNSIVALHIDGFGLLSDPVKTSTGGVGDLSTNVTFTPDTTDALGSQGAVTVSGNLLFTVNAGSDTVSMFVIDPSDPWSPKLVGTPASTLGQFPVSVTYSEQLNQACVLNGGAVAGVTCFSVDPVHGLSVIGTLRSIPTSVFDETTPPTGPPGAASQILFNPQSTALFATVRGGTAEIPNGSILVWPVHGGSVSESGPVVTTISDLVLDFGFLFTPDNQMFLVDPTFGISLLDVKPDWTLVETVHTVVEGESALCWTAYDAVLNTAYGIDAGAGIDKFDPSTGAYIGNISLELPGGEMGGFDSAIFNNVMYSLVATDGVTAVDLVQGKQIQYLNLTSFGDRQYYQGMAVWP